MHLAPGLRVKGREGRLGGQGEQIISKKNTALVAIEAITSRILVLRGQRVMLDADLATLYGVQTRRLNEQVRRNTERFPEDFVFQLAPAEFAHLKSQFGEG